MLLELIVIAALLYVLINVHKQDLAKGGPGIAVLGPYLEELDEMITRAMERHRTALRSSAKRRRGSMSSSSSLSKDSIIEQNTQPMNTPMEKFENVQTAHSSDGSRSKHHHSKHRSKLESALVNAQKGPSSNN